MYYNINKAMLMGTVEKMETNGSGDVRMFVCTLSSEKVGDEWKRMQEYHTVIITRDKAQYISKMIDVGAVVCIEGVIKSRTVQDNRRVTEIVISGFNGKIDCVMKKRDDSAPKQSAPKTAAKPALPGHVSHEAAADPDDDEIPF
jgi:single-stranded DNA-binding protein